jgi:serine/threonine protein kinase
MEAAKRERHRLALPLGYHLGSYEFREQLGVGSFGITYLADDHALRRKVAIKELLPTMIATRCETVRVEPHTSDEEEQWQWAQERFMGEAQTLAKCEHANILHVFEAFRANGTAYMVTQFEEGCTLTRWLRNLGRPPTENELRAILEPLLSALDTVHAHQFLHRDIKPDNIYMTGGNRPVLIDFGSARQDVTQRSVPMTAIVTEGYAPFEQYSETGRQGPWTDLYALAAVMYCAIVGRKPPSAAERAAADEEDPCICLAAGYGSQYSLGLLQGIDAGLRLNARARLQSTTEWRSILSGSIPVRPEETRTPTGFPGTPATPPQPGTRTTPEQPGTQTAPQQPGTQQHWSYAPKIPAVPPPLPKAAARGKKQGRILRWLKRIVFLIAGIIVVVLLVKLEQSNQALMRAKQDKENASREAQAFKAELEDQKAKNDQQKPRSTPTPKPPRRTPAHGTSKSH